MRNGYFRLVKDGGGTGIALYPPQDGGEDIRLGELLGYLDGQNIAYDRKRIEMLLREGQETVCRIGVGVCPQVPETYTLSVSEDGMLATVRFFPPSEGAPRMSYDEFIGDLGFKKIVFGIQTDGLKKHFGMQPSYCEDVVVAKGEDAVAGVDARIEYMFETDLERKPTLREDGSVDYFHMTVINQCRKGDVLAQIIPEQQGVDGHDIYGKSIKPKAAHPAVLRFGRNIALSEDKRSITSKVDGHVTLVDDKVFVSDVYEVTNVDVSTGNIEFEGSVQVNGDVSENYEVKAGGNVIVNGLVEGARIIAGGNIIVAKGMNGMSKGFLRAGGNVIVKFLENTKVVAGGYVQAEAILHSKVSAGDEIIVEGRKGMIVGGYAQASRKITAKCIGANLGATTVLEVGMNPLVKVQSVQVQEKIAECTKTIEDAQTILSNFKDKVKRGIQYTEAQLLYMKSLSAKVQEKNKELEKLNARVEQLKQKMELQKTAEVVVNDEIYPGTTIIIGDTSKAIQSGYHYCKFVREQGEIKMAPM